MKEVELKGFGMGSLREVVWGFVARYENGWIKVHRRAVIEDIGDNSTCLALWVMLLSLANWKETKIMWEGKQRTLPPGSVVFGFREFAERWGCSKNTVKKWAEYLHSTNRILLEVCPRGCLATICNWEKYQTREDDECPKLDHNATTTRPQSDHNVTLNEEGKNVRREESLSQGVQKCIEEWKFTLTHFGVDRELKQFDEDRIARAVQRYGYEWVSLAFQGARKQQKSAKWDPSQFVSLTSYLDPNKIERLVNIGAGKEDASEIDWSKVFGKVPA